MIELRHVYKSFGANRVLDGLGLRIERGTTSALIGPSGCGKSTCLRLMLGLIRADAGEVRFDGAPLGAAEVLAVRRRVGYVVQSGGLFPHLSARRNITLMAHELGWTADRIDARLAELIALSRFPADHLDRYPAELSGGQGQRVALMRALMLDPEALLLDEPLGALDPMIRYELQTELYSIIRQLGKTVVLVTHDLAEAAYLADNIVLLRAGAIVQQGTLAHMLEHPADKFVERFITAQSSRVLALPQAARP